MIMGMHFVWFMLFSTIEGFSVYALTLYTFRLDFRKYFLHSLIIIELINFQNFLTREEVASLAYMAPVINLLITVLFLKTIVRIPIFWSFVMTILGYAAYIVLQSLLIVLFFSIDQVQNYPPAGYLVQFLTGVIGTFLGWSLYRRGWGFSFNFGRFHLKKEHIFVTLLIVFFILLLGATAYLLNVFTSLVGFLICLFVFLYYSIRKENTDN